MPYLRCTAVCSARVSGKPHSLAMLAIDAEEPDSFLQASSNRRSVRNSLNVLPVALRNRRQKCSLPYPNSRATSVASRCCLRCDVMYPMICMVMFLPDLTNSGRRTPETNLEYSSDSNSYSSILSLNPRMASSDCCHRMMSSPNRASRAKSSLVARGARRENMYLSAKGYSRSKTSSLNVAESTSGVVPSVFVGMP